MRPMMTMGSMVGVLAALAVGWPARSLVARTGVSEQTTQSSVKEAPEMATPVVAWQIMAKDPEAMAAFYTRLFGWKVHDDNALGFRRIETGGSRGIDGGIWPSPPEGHSFVQLFIEVGDVSAYVEKAVSHGAKVLIPPQKLPDGDEMAILLGPEGVSFGLKKRR